MASINQIDWVHQSIDQCVAYHIWANQLLKQPIKQPISSLVSSTVSICITLRCPPVRLVFIYQSINHLRLIVHLNQILSWFQTWIQHLTRSSMDGLQSQLDVMVFWASMVLLNMLTWPQIKDRYQLVSHSQWLVQLSNQSINLPVSEVPQKCYLLKLHSTFSPLEHGSISPFLSFRITDQSIWFLFIPLINQSF